MITDQREPLWSQSLNFPRVFRSDAYFQTRTYYGEPFWACVLQNSIWSSSFSFLHLGPGLNISFAFAYLARIEIVKSTRAKLQMPVLDYPLSILGFDTISRETHSSLCHSYNILMTPDPNSLVSFFTRLFCHETCRMGLPPTQTDSNSDYGNSPFLKIILWTLNFILKTAMLSRSHGDPFRLDSIYLYTSQHN